MLVLEQLDDVRGSLQDGGIVCQHPCSSAEFAMFDLLLYGSHPLGVVCLAIQRSIPIHAWLWDWPNDLRVRFQPVPRILPRSQSRGESDLGESQEVQEGSIRRVLDEGPCQPLCCLAKRRSHQARDGLGGSGER